MKKLICIGNQWRRDDGLGIRVAELFSPNESKKDFIVVTCTRESMDLLENLKDCQKVVIVDAVKSGSREPGSIFEFDLEKTQLPEKVFSYSTHAFSVNQTVELAKVLGITPHIHIVGVEGEDFSQGEGLTPKVEQSLSQVKAIIENLL